MDRVFGELPGVHVIVDDILVSGSTREDHDERLRAALTAARRNGVKFNPKKIQKCSSEVKFFGELITKDGLKLDPSKVAAVTDDVTAKQERVGESARHVHLLGSVSICWRKLLS
jgi:DNA invertase Pin-like site-specific DNA recombinase